MNILQKASALAGFWLDSHMYEYATRAVTARRNVEALVSGEPSDDDIIEVVGGPTIRYGDIPKDANGEISPAWLDDNCKCGNVHGSEAGSGMYL